MSLVSSLQALCHVVPWQLRRPTVMDAKLWQDAEFQVTLRELRYLPIRRSCDSGSGRHSGTGIRKQHTSE